MESDRLRVLHDLAMRIARLSHGRPIRTLSVGEPLSAGPLRRELRSFPAATEHSFVRADRRTSPSDRRGCFSGSFGKHFPGGVICCIDFPPDGERLTITGAAMTDLCQ